jgi:hypothetical protein
MEKGKYSLESAPKDITIETKLKYIGDIAKGL